MAKEHILLVEDEEHLATGIKFNLEAEGWRVTLVGDGPSALKLLEEDPGGFDLMILDLMLPGMSGYAVCESLRENDRELPVLILSARTLAEDRARGFNVGANQYLTKPFDLDEFLSRIRNLLTLHGRRTSPGAAPSGSVNRIEFGEAKVNFDTFEVTVAGEPVQLTQMEMSLLRYFVTHEGRVIPRRELLDKVWNMPGNVSSRAPDQFIVRLRKAFEPDPASPRHLLTIRDAGYRFVSKPE